MKPVDKANSKNIGNLGEEIACRFLMKHGYLVIGRNFRQKCGEIDIIARKADVLHFVEVKTVSRERSAGKIGGRSDDHRPEDNIHFRKLDRLQRTIQIYLLKNNVPHETKFQVDGITVYLDDQSRKASVRLIENINL